MPDLTEPQAKLLTLAATTGLKRTAPGLQFGKSYSRPAINSLIRLGMLDHNWQITSRGRAWVEAARCAHSAGRSALSEQVAPA